MKIEKSKDTLSWIYKYSKSNLPWVILLSVITGVISFCFIWLALVSKQVLDIATGDAQGNLWFSIFEIAGIIILQCVLNVVYANILIRVNGKMDVKLKQGLFSQLLNKKWQSLSKFHSGEIINRFTSDVDTVISGILDILPTAISLLTRLIAGLWVLFAIDWRFTLIVMALGVVVFFAGKLYSKHFKYLHKELQTSHGFVRSFIQECYENISVLKSFANNELIQDKLLTKQKDMLKLMYKKQSISNVANTGVYMLFTGSYYVALIWGAVNISLGAITFGTLTAFLQILDQIKGPMASISGLIPKFYSMLASAERLMEIENLPNEESIRNIEDVDKLYSEMENIVLKNIYFKYKDKFVLENASATIKKGDIVAIAGPSGIGKSTLMKLLLGLIEIERGQIYVETNSKKITIDSGMRKLFSYVPQGNMILSGTIRENISLSNPNATDEEIEKAADDASILKFINTLPKAMDTIVGERGVGLSEGQIQRIAIARALVSKAPILLLDEATSALDEKTEKILLENIRALKNKTCIFISHKPRTISMCDKIIGFKDKELKDISYNEIVESWK